MGPAIATTETVIVKVFLNKPRLCLSHASVVTFAYNVYISNQMISYLFTDNKEDATVLEKCALNDEIMSYSL